MHLRPNRRKQSAKLLLGIGSTAPASAALGYALLRSRRKLDLRGKAILITGGIPFWAAISCWASVNSSGAAAKIKRYKRKPIHRLFPFCWIGCRLHDGLGITVGPGKMGRSPLCQHD